MNEVKRFTEGPIGKGLYVDPNGELCGFHHLERVTAERDAALGREVALREDLSTANGCLNEWRRSTLGRTLLENTALQQRLTAEEESAKLWEHRACLEATKLHAADERAGVLEAALRKIKARLDAYAEAGMRMPESSVEVCQMIASAALKPAEGGGDEPR